MSALHDALEGIEEFSREQQSLTEGELADEDPDYLEWDDSEFAEWWEEQSDDEGGLYDWDDYKESYLDEYSEQDDWYDLYGEEYDEDYWLEDDEDAFWREWHEGQGGEFLDDEDEYYFAQQT